MDKISQQGRLFAETLNENRVNFDESMAKLKNALPEEIDKLVEDLTRKNSSKK